VGALRVHAVPALAALVVGSALIRFVVSLGVEIPWITPDEVLYGLTGQSLWETGTLSLRGLSVPYTSLVTPALVGAPLALFDVASGLTVAQALQSLVMSAAAIPVFLWARRLTTPGWALAAAALTVLVPGLAYGGTLMTEAAFYPLAVAALASGARVLEQPTLLRQGVFFGFVTLAAAVRMQALVLVPTLVLAAVLHGYLTRSWRTVRALAVIGAAALAAAAVVAVVAVATGGGSVWEDLLGAYQPVLERSVSTAAVIGAIAVHAAGIALVCLVLPLVATIVVCRDAVRSRSSGPEAAFVATAVSYVLFLVVQVGVFAAQNVGYLSQRYLLTAAPVLFVGFAVWLGRGAPRPRLVVGATAATVVAAALLVPIGDLVPDRGIQDALWTTWLQGVAADSTGDARMWLVVATAILLAALLLPTRWRPAAAAVLVGAGLFLLSVDASRTARRESQARQRITIGSEPPAWLPAHDGDVTMLVTDDQPAGSVARTVFWNPSIRSVVRLEEAEVTVPPGAPVVESGAGGLLSTGNGDPLAVPLLLAPATVTIEGELISQRLDATTETPGWKLWRLDGDARMTTRVVGAMPNGDITGEVTVLAPGCLPGALELTLLGKSGDPVTVTVDGIPWGQLEAPNGAVVHERIPAPPYADGTHTCVFSLATGGLVGSTRIEYVVG
jgi:hypothetical protein